jgi:hypothetical protein
LAKRRVLYSVTVSRVFVSSRIHAVSSFAERMINSTPSMRYSKAAAIVKAALGGE